MFFLEVEQRCSQGEEGEKRGRKPCEFTPHYHPSGAYEVPQFEGRSRKCQKWKEVAFSRPYFGVS